MSYTIRIMACACWLLSTSPLWSQRYLPDLHAFTTTETLQLDAYVEHPAINSGMGAAGMPVRGENLAFQIFVPRAGGQIAFDSFVTINNLNLSRTFRIVSVKDWQQRDLSPIASTTAQTYHSGRLALSKLPYSGHVATVTLTPVENPAPLRNIQVACTVTTVSIPPRRIWRMRGVQNLPLR